jgi:sulfatase maturation enzyme AslB (radical SAM superfamily)
MAAPWPLASVALVLTGACNLRCTYCYQTVKRPGRMRWPTARAATDHLWMSTSPSRRLVLTGGEPLLAFPLVKRLVALARSGDPLGRAIDVTLLTNGTRMGSAQAEFLARNRVDVQISIDGPLPAQAQRGAWTFPRLDRLLDHLRGDHPAWFRRHVSVAVTVPPVNIPALADAAEYLLAKGVTSIVIGPAMGASTGWNAEMRAQLDEQFARLLRVSLAVHRRSGRVPIAWFRRASGRSGQPAQPMCGVARGTKVVVDTEGGVYGCTPAIAAFQHEPPAMLRRASEAMRLGHVADPQLAERLPGYRDAVRAAGLFGPRSRMHSSYGDCGSCRHVGRCMVCPLAIAYAPGASDPTRVPDYLCAFNDVALDYQARFASQAVSKAGPADQTVC